MARHAFRNLKGHIMGSHFLQRARDNMPLGLLKMIINLWPPLLGAGISIKDMATDYSFVDVTLKLRWYNKNYVGTHFGGSIFAMTDPFYMLMLIKNLGDGYIVWDKAARIDFKKPGRGTLQAHFEMTPEIIKQVKDNTSNNQKYIFDLPIDVVNEQKEVVATVIRTLYVRTKEGFDGAKLLPPNTPPSNNVTSSS
jgi:acyl-coenzyme A thioesterase PaaI-like protein